MADTGLVDSVGLSMATLFPSLGQTAADNFGKILDILSKKTPANAATLASIVDGLKLWCVTCQLPAKVTLLKEHQARLFDIIASLAVANDASKTGDYKGDVYAASVLTESLDNAAKMDVSQEMLALFAPSAFSAVERILKSPGATLEVKVPMRNEDTIGTYRGEVVMSLMRILPYSKQINIPNAVTVVHSMLTSSVIPASIKTKARDALVSMRTVNRECIIHSGPALIELMRLGGNDGLGIMFSSDNDVYFNNPEAVHKNLDLFLKPDSFLIYGALFMSIGSRFPEALVPHIAFFVQAISTPSAGTLAMSVLVNIADKSAAKFTAEQMKEVVSKGKNVNKGEYFLAKFVGRFATVPGAAETCFGHLLDLLDTTTEGDSIMGIYVELSNVMALLPSRDILLKYMGRLSAKKAYAGILFKEIEDYANG